MSRPAVRIVNDSMSESVDLLQMLIAPPPPPPSTSRPVAPSRHVEDGITASLQRPRTEQMCYRACHACAEEQRYRQQQQQQQHQNQQPECAYCSCPQPCVDPRPQRADRNDTASIYFNPRGPLPLWAGAGPGRTWPRRPPPVKAHGSTLSAPRADISGTLESNCTVQAGLPSGRSSTHCGDDDVDNIDNYEDAAGKRTMSTSLSSRSSSRTQRLRSAADICRRARRAAVTDCCLRCRPRRRANTNSATAIAGDPLHRNTATDIDLCFQSAHGGHSESATADGSVRQLGRKLPLRRGLRCTTRWNINADRKRTILLIVGFLVGLFFVSTALLTGFVLLWPSQRRRHSISEFFVGNELLPVDAADQSQASPTLPIDYITVVPSLDKAVPDRGGLAMYSSVGYWAAPSVGGLLCMLFLMALMLLYVVILFEAPFARMYVDFEFE